MATYDAFYRHTFGNFDAGIDYALPCESEGKDHIFYLPRQPLLLSAMNDPSSITSQRLQDLAAVVVEGKSVALAIAIRCSTIDAITNPLKIAKQKMTAEELKAMESFEEDPGYCAFICAIDSSAATLAIEEDASPRELQWLGYCATVLDEMSGTKGATLEQAKYVLERSLLAPLLRAKAKVCEAQVKQQSVETRTAMDKVELGVITFAIYKAYADLYFVPISQQDMIAISASINILHMRITALRVTLADSFPEPVPSITTKSLVSFTENYRLQEWIYDCKAAAARADEEDTNADLQSTASADIS